MFGKVTSGVVVVFSIGKVATDGNDEPIVPVVMDSLRVTSSPLRNLSYASDKIPGAVYPNPVHTNSVLSFDSPISGMAEIEFHDHSGKLIYHIYRDVNNGSNEISLDFLKISELNAGIYFLHLRLDGVHKVFTVQNL